MVQTNVSMLIGKEGGSGDVTMNTMYDHVIFRYRACVAPTPLPSEAPSLPISQASTTCPPSPTSPAIGYWPQRRASWSRWQSRPSTFGCAVLLRSARAAQGCSTSSGSSTIKMPASPTSPTRRLWQIASGLLCSQSIACVTLDNMSKGCKFGRPFSCCTVILQSPWVVSRSHSQRRVGDSLDAPPPAPGHRLPQCDRRTACVCMGASRCIYTREVRESHDSTRLCSHPTSRSHDKR